MLNSRNGDSKWRFQPLLFSAAVGVGVLAVLVAVSQKGRVTHASFARIRIGMPRAELHDLLGRAPDFRVMDVGKVNGHDNYAVNFGTDPKELRRKGYLDYRREVWISSETTITVISDSRERVVCRYCSGGQSRLRDFSNWFSSWFKNPKISRDDLDRRPH